MADSNGSAEHVHDWADPCTAACPAHTAPAKTAQHNHVTRNFLPLGKCPGCDAYYDQHGDFGVGEIAPVKRPIPPEGLAQ